MALESLNRYKEAKVNGDTTGIRSSLEMLQQNFPYFGYAYLNTSHESVPNVPLTFYSFHLMVYLGFYFILLFIVILIFLATNKLEGKRWLLRVTLWTIPLAYLASQAGWIVAEMGRQPWVIQDLMPTMAAASKINPNAVVITFWLFAAIFTILLIAEVMIMVRQIKIGPKDGGTR